MLKPNNLFIGFFDDISVNPEKFILDIYNFLGVRSKIKYVNEISQKKIAKTDNTQYDRTIPPKVEDLLYDLFSKEIEYISNQLGRNLDK